MKVIILFVLIDSIIKYSYLKIYGSTTRIILVLLFLYLLVQEFGAWQLAAVWVLVFQVQLASVFPLDWEWAET